MKHLIIIVLSLVLVSTFPSALSAQDEIDKISQAKEWMFKATETNSVTLWNKAILLLKESESDPESILQSAFAYYGLIGAHFGNRDKQKAKEAIDQGMELAEKLLKSGQFKSEAYALISGFQGMTIAISPMKGMFLGAKSDSNIKKALKEDENNAFAWLQQGSSQYNTPKIFGGSVEDSIDSFTKAIGLYNTNDQSKSWQKIEAQIWLGQAYNYTEQSDKAIAVYNEILEIMPNHQWVKQVLLPKAIANQESN